MISQDSLLEKQGPVFSLTPKYTDSMGSRSNSQLNSLHGQELSFRNRRGLYAQGLADNCFLYFEIACVASRVLGARNKVLSAELLIASGDAARRIILAASPVTISGSAGKTDSLNEISN